MDILQYAKFKKMFGGSGECSGKHVIQVDVLPTEDIDETALYECGGEYYVSKIDTNTTWMLNDRLDISMLPKYEEVPVSFTISTGEKVTYLRRGNWSEMMQEESLQYGFADDGSLDTVVYITEDFEGNFSSYGGWAGEAYKTITFLETPTNEAVIAWRTANGVPVPTRVWSKYTEYTAPTGSLMIEENGEYDVTNKAIASVAVPASLLVKSIDDLPTDAPMESTAIVMGDSSTYSDVFVPVSMQLPMMYSSIWTDGTTTYYSDGVDQYVLNGDTWETKSWNGLTSFSSSHIWTDGTNTYYSRYDDQYVLNGDTWETKSWGGLTSFYGEYIWTDGTNTYYSYGASQYVLNGDTWETKSWGGLTNFNGDYIWTDGVSMYYSYRDKQYVLNGDTWETKSWGGLTSFNGGGIWTDGVNMYYSNVDDQYVLNGDTWETKSWGGLTSFNGGHIWSNGTNIYYSHSDSQYILIPSNSKLFAKTIVGDWTELGEISGDLSGELTITANGTYDVTKYASAKVEVPMPEGDTLTEFLKVRDGKNLFYGLNQITEIPFINGSVLTTAMSMFSNCKKLITIPLLDTSNVKRMSYMFDTCNGLTSVPAMNTSKVTEMDNMFRACKVLTSVPLFDTRRVWNCSGMFYDCNALTSVPAFDFRQAHNFSTMFGLCNALTDIHIRNINESIQVSNGTSYGHLLTVDSLTHLIYELRITSYTKTLTVGSANLEKLANVYVKLVDITDEMRAEDDLIDEKLPFVVCESTDEGAALITDYVSAKNWSLV